MTGTGAGGGGGLGLLSNAPAIVVPNCINPPIAPVIKPAGPNSGADANKPVAAPDKASSPKLSPVVAATLATVDAALWASSVIFDTV